MTPPSIHVRAFITWLAIFPLVSVGFLTVIPLLKGLNPLLQVLVLTLLVVPAAVYVVVPNLMKLYFLIQKRRAA